MDSWNPPQIVRFSSKLILFVQELIVLLIPSETDVPLGALHVLDDGVDREKTMRSGFISPHPVSFKAGTLVTYSHPPPPLRQPRLWPESGPIAS